MNTKDNTGNYDFECGNCDEVFFYGDKKKMDKHKLNHQKHLPEGTPTGFWEVFGDYILNIKR